MTNEDKKLANDIIGNKFQWSKFSPDRSEQYVIRTDTEEEFDRLVKKYREMTPKAGKPFPDDEGPVAVLPDSVQAPVMTCGVHKTPLTYRPAGVSKTGKPYKAFWSCQEKDAQGNFCKWRPQ